MRKTGMKRWLLGAIAGVATLAGCGDNGRSWAMVAQDDYMPSALAPSSLPEEGSAMGGSGSARMSAGLQDERRANSLWLKQDFRVPYPQDSFVAQAGQELGPGKPLRADARGVWVQGTYAVEMGSGITRNVSAESAPYQPQQQNINGSISTPHSPPSPR